MAYHLDGLDEITNREDLIDSREVIARIDYLTSEREDLVSALETAQADLDDPDNHEEREAYQDALDAAQAALKDWDESDEADELKALQAFAKEAEDYAEDWRHGCTLIRESYWEDYARETAEELYGDKIRDCHWPFTCIDWEKAASELQMDYTSAEFDGVTYWVR